jgi:hypothetical protein
LTIRGTAMLYVSVYMALRMMRDMSRRPYTPPKIKY